MEAKLTKKVILNKLLALVVAGMFYTPSLFALDASLDKLMGTLKALQTNLFSLDVEKTQKEAEALTKQVADYKTKTELTPTQAKALAWIEEGATAVAKAGVTLDGQRLAFQTLSRGFCLLARETAELKATVTLWLCPMVKGFGFWLQPANEAMYNPHKGAKDHCAHCGVKAPWEKLSKFVD